MRIMAIIALAGIGWLLPTGCHTNYTQPVARPATLTPEERSFEAIWLASLDVLRKNDFVIDRQDRRAGIITTRPLLGRHWFELWRHDAVGWYNKWESTLQTIYRTAEVRVRPEGPGSTQFIAQVQVQTSRTDRIVRDVTNTSEAYNLFTLPAGIVDKTLLTDITSQEEVNVAELTAGIVQLGPDRLLSERLAGQINCAAAQRILEGNYEP